MVRQVGVIGGGPAGLCATRRILDSQGLSPVVWEQNTQVGGAWVYSPNTGTKTHGPCMYQNLKTNLPKEVMHFEDFPFPATEEESFIHHTKVLRYLEDYADHFNLLPHIKFGHHVESVVPEVRDDNKTSWRVTVKDLNTDTSTTSVCDAVIVCTNHYSVPHLPDIEHLDKFTGTQTHSRDYREPSVYKDKTVVVLGAGNSGLDITLELSNFAKKVVLSHNKPSLFPPSAVPAGVQQARGVVEAREHGFIMNDGSYTPADAIICCTGYEYSYPFLSESCGITVMDYQVVKPLYNHTINAAHPTMAFLGIITPYCPTFPLFDCQALLGKITLPSKAQMAEELERAWQTHRSRGQPDRYFHHQDVKELYGYINRISRLAEIPLVPTAVGHICDSLDASRQRYLTFKTAKYRITGPESFEMINP